MGGSVQSLAEPFFSPRGIKIRALLGQNVPVIQCDSAGLERSPSPCDACKLVRMIGNGPGEIWKLLLLRI